MIEKAMENFIVNAAYAEVLNYKKQGKIPVVESYEVDQWSYIIEIMIITIKSLKPSKISDGNIIDYERFKSELILWTQYRHGMNKNLLYGVDNRLSEEYFTGIDESIYARISIIVLANENWETIKSEVIKTTLYTSGNIEIMLECIQLSKLLFLKLKHPKYDYEDILRDLKDEIINFSQTELNDYEKYYKVSRDSYEKNYKIEFERMRINLISILNEIDLSYKFTILKECLDILKDSVDTGLNKNSTFFISGLIGLINGEVLSEEVKDIVFLESLCVYITKLRKGRITLDSLGLDHVILPDIFKYEKGEIFSHPLLNSCKILYTGDKGKFKVSYVSTRTGIYRFVKTNKD